MTSKWRRQKSAHDKLWLSKVLAVYVSLSVNIFYDRTRRCDTHAVLSRSDLCSTNNMNNTMSTVRAKKFLPPGGSRKAPLRAGVSFCLQTGVSGALLTPQYDTPSMRADGN